MAWAATGPTPAVGGPSSQASTQARPVHPTGAAVAAAPTRATCRGQPPATRTVRAAGPTRHRASCPLTSSGPASQRPGARGPATGITRAGHLAAETVVFEGGAVVAAIPRLGAREGDGPGLARPQGPGPSVAVTEGSWPSPPTQPVGTSTPTVIRSAARAGPLVAPSGTRGYSPTGKAPGLVSRRQPPGQATQGRQAGTTTSVRGPTAGAPDEEAARAPMPSMAGGPTIAAPTLGRPPTRLLRYWCPTGHPATSSVTRRAAGPTSPTAGPSGRAVPCRGRSPGGPTGSCILVPCPSPGGSTGAGAGGRPISGAGWGPAGPSPSSPAQALSTDRVGHRVRCVPQLFGGRSPQPRLERCVQRLHL